MFPRRGKRAVSRARQVHFLDRVEGWPLPEVPTKVLLFVLHSVAISMGLLNLGRHLPFYEFMFRSFSFIAFMFRKFLAHAQSETRLLRSSCSSCSIALGLHLF